MNKCYKDKFSGIVEIVPVFDNNYGHKRKVKTEVDYLVKIWYIKKSRTFKCLCIGKAQVKDYNGYNY